MSNTIKVWVMPHDDPKVRWVVNTEDDMRGNYDDMLAEDHETGPFQGYLDSWIEVDMPDEVYLADDATLHAWIEKEVNGR